MKYKVNDLVRFVRPWGVSGNIKVGEIRPIRFTSGGLYVHINLKDNNANGFYVKGNEQYITLHITKKLKLRLP